MTLSFAPERIETWPLERLKPYARNAKTHRADQIAKIAASMAKFGWTNPVLVDGDNGITFWNVATLQELMTIARPATLNFLMMSPDGNVLALKAPADRHTLGGVETWAPPGLESIDSSLSGLSNPHE